MKVVIFCGGRGYRLNEETEFRPKPMMPIGGMPILWHIMKIYAHQGHREFILCLGYRSEMIKEFFRNYRWHTEDVTIHLGRDMEVEFHNGDHQWDWTVTLSETGLGTSTAGRLASVAKYLKDDKHFLLTYGDGVGNVDINKAIEIHQASSNICTLTAAHPPGRFGELVLDPQGKITRFNEKPQTEEGLINAGYMVCSREMIDIARSHADEMLEQGPMLELVRAGKLGCYVHSGFWQPMDTYQEFHLLSDLWNKKKAPWKVW